MICAWIVCMGLFFSIGAFAMGKPKPNPEFDPSVSNELRQQIQDDLSVLYGIPEHLGAGPLHREIFGEISGKSYEAFFNQRVNLIQSGDCGGATDTVACARHFLGIFQRRIELTNHYRHLSIPQAFRLSYLFHEARHLEPPLGRPHALCPKTQRDSLGFEYGSTTFQGLSACDTSARGSYGLQVIQMINLSRNCTSCTDKFRADAELLAAHFFTRIIDIEARDELEEEYDFLRPQKERVSYATESLKANSTQ